MPANGGFTYTPNTGYIGIDSFTYKANDGRQSPTGDSNAATVKITVGPDVIMGMVDSDLRNGIRVHYEIALYSSVDGQTLGDQLASTSGNTQPGIYTWLVPSTLAFSESDHYLIAKADPAGTITEASEDNTRLYTSSTFVGTDATTGNHILYVNGRDVADTFNVFTAASENRLYVQSNYFGYHDYDPAAVDEVRIYAHGGNDQVDVSSDFDKPVRIFGGDGNDTLSGGALHDIIFGGLGADILDGNAGDDQLDGGAGNDWLYGGDHDDILLGGEDNDTLSGELGSDELSGGAGDDDLISDAEDLLGAVANKDSYYVVGNSTLTVEAPGVLDDDYNVEGDDMSAVLVQGAAHGTVTLSADGSFTYSPTTDFTGTDSFTYKASNESGDCEAVIVTLEVEEPRNISVTGFYSDNEDLKIDYSVSTDLYGPITIGIFASSDGISYETKLGEVTHTPEVGSNTVTIQPTFVDLDYDYVLTAVVDSAGEIDETSESDNSATSAAAPLFQTRAAGERSSTFTAQAVPMLSPWKMQVPLKSTFAAKAAMTPSRLTLRSLLLAGCLAAMATISSSAAAETISSTERPEKMS